MSADFPAENLLGRETSPYLLQHRDNPVHWRAWGDAMFAEARARDVPILLSVGYAACHWCHVMAHESFEDSAAAAEMNRLFVNVKVDREERPDIDTIYMSALHLMGEQGGWPLTMFLTPEGEPFWGGTYFPPEPRYGRPSFRQVLISLSEAWKNRRAEVTQNVGALLQALKAQAPGRDAKASGEIAPDTLDRMAVHLAGLFDPVHGGLKGAPKFPQTSIVELVWRGARRTGDAALRRAVTVTLDRISQGGIYDHLGGGYARYSTDAQWLAPHFEKMLYDNADLIQLLTLVWRDTGAALYARRVEETIDWLMRDMAAEADGFAASLDADSEGEEGKFYVWTEAEIDALLGGEAALFKQHYDVGPGGNWEGHTILNRTQLPALADDATEARLARCRAVLLAVRVKRIPPGRDDKVLADWNGMTIRALALAGFAFDRADWSARAAAAFAGIMGGLRAPAGETDAGRLRHSYRLGQPRHRAMLDDYAHMTAAAVTLHETTGRSEYLHQAEALVADVDRWYWDDDAGGYFFTAADAPNLIARTKAAHDNPTPSGNGVLADVLNRLYLLTGKSAYRDRAAAVIAAFAGQLAKNFFPMATLINAAECMARPLQVVVVGVAGAPDTRALLRAIAAAPSPNLVLQQTAPDTALPEGHPARGKGMIGGKAAVYICEGPVCSAPLTDPAALAAELKSR